MDNCNINTCGQQRNIWVVWQLLQFFFAENVCINNNYKTNNYLNIMSYDIRCINNLIFFLKGCKILEYWYNFVLSIIFFHSVL